MVPIDMKRLLYFGYYLKNLEFPSFRKYLNYVREKHNQSFAVLLTDIVASSFKYNISILEYFQFGFFELTPEERAKWAGTGFMYEYQLVMNPKKQRAALEDKRIFLKKFGPFVFHNWADRQTLEKDPAKFKTLKENPSARLVLKKHDGQCGKGVKIISTSGLDRAKLFREMDLSGNDLVEEFIVQHPSLMKLSSSGLNTIRIFTQVNAEGGVDFLGCRIRITVNSAVDNLAAGNLAAPVDFESGKITGPGVYADMTKKDEFIHPVSQAPIIGFQVPFWSETLDMVEKAALFFPECLSIGWDIAITERGPELIEGNHDWCKLVWQLPVRKGLKPVLEKHLMALKK